ncbi:LOW QUALITY PROTEIN: hypothetical protein YC2023_102376 [Brassica napus]
MVKLQFPANTPSLDLLERNQKRSVPILSKGKPPASKRWERSDKMNLIDPPLIAPPSVGSSRQIANFEQHDVSIGRLFVDLQPENYESPIASSKGLKLRGPHDEEYMYS